MHPSTEPVLVRAPNPGLMTLEGTNTWVIPGSGGAVVIDPGPVDARHLAAIGRYRPIAAVLLTHGHDDHSAAVAALSQSIPVHAVDARFARGVPPLSDGQVIEAGGTRLRVLATPGHTTDSVCFLYDGAEGGPVVFTGDTLLGGRQSTYLVSDGGGLGAYFATLEVFQTLAGYRCFPGHGPVMADVASHARAAASHRRARLRDLREHLDAGGTADPAGLAAERYPGEPKRQRFAAGMIEMELGYLGRG